MSSKIRTMDIRVSMGGREILNGISTAIPEGAIFTIVGPSGAGKSTFLRTLNRLIEVDSGDILLDGISIKEIDPLQLRKRVGMVFQIPIAFEGSVEENLRVGPALIGGNEPDVPRLLEMVGLGVSFRKRKALDLSVGEQQRMCIARALANEPEVLLMDEPTSSLDPGSSRRIEELIIELRDRFSLTFVVVTHNMAQSKRIGDWTMLMGEGEVITTMETQEFFTSFEPEDIQ